MKKDEMGRVRSMYREKRNAMGNLIGKSAVKR
jgi:hypothetical protein